MLKRPGLYLFFCLAGWGAVTPVPGRGDEVALKLQSRVAAPDGHFQLRTSPATWDLQKTAIIVCDMWDSHHCLNAVIREQELAPRMNQLLTKARTGGALIIHAPSSCMAPYAKHPARKRAQDAPKAANLPKDIGTWCYKIPAEEKGVYPLDQTESCDTEPALQKEWEQKLQAQGRNPKAPWKAQIDVLKIHDQDAISDSGVEIWNLLEQRGIQHVILVGVHTNMCVLGRPFGLRQLAKNGRDVVLMRDMTDTMYNPKRWPYVSHFQGTDLIVQHIEKYVCPTITSDQFLGGAPFRYKADVRPSVVIAISGCGIRYENRPAAVGSADFRGPTGAWRVTVLHGKDDTIPGFAAAAGVGGFVGAGRAPQGAAGGRFAGAKKIPGGGKAVDRPAVGEPCV